MDRKKEQQFVETVKDNRQALWRVAFGILHTRADAEDAVSSAVENTWRRLERLRSMDALKVYLIRSTIHAAYDEVKRRKRIVSVETLPEEPSAQVHSRGIADYVSDMEEKYRILLVLKFDEGLHEKEIAQIMHMSRGTVSSRISRALETLRKEMKKEGTEHA